MLKIEDTKKVVEYKGTEYELKVPSAKDQTAFAVKVEKETDPLQQCDLMIEFTKMLGVDAEVAEEMSVENLQAIIEYASTTGKK